jgi:hypothetical protein
MNTKSSAITFSILIILIVLGVLLGFTSFYIDQATIRPIVLMKDSEVEMKCFLMLIRNVNGYLRKGENPPSNSLRSSLLSNYNIQSDAVQLKETQNLEDLGYKGIFIGNESIFKNFLSYSEHSVECYIRSYGPVEKGFIAIYK